MASEQSEKKARVASIIFFPNRESDKAIVEDLKIEGEHCESLGARIVPRPEALELLHRMHQGNKERI